jgi:2-dehydro-3-deoxyphosphogluconate aldolase/(4S)-4-hydroxy-2-oxoglutarate aldolase
MSSPESSTAAHSARDVADRLVSMRVIPVLRLPSRERAAAAIDCLIEAGYRTVELTLTTPDAIGLLAELRRRAASEFLVGAGTVLDLDSAARCLDAGADYLVSPCLVPGMARLAAERGRAALIGGFTPGEVLAAWREGAQIVKLFPAATGGPGHLAAIHAICPDIPLCPTGGVSQANMLEWFKAGARVVGVGNNVMDQKALAAGDRTQVIRHARAFLELAASVPIDQPHP